MTTITTPVAIRPRTPRLSVIARRALALAAFVLSVPFLAPTAFLVTARLVGSAAEHATPLAVLAIIAAAVGASAVMAIAAQAEDEAREKFDIR